jgi:hypothetical protein
MVAIFTRRPVFVLEKRDTPRRQESRKYFYFLSVISDGKNPMARRFKSL